MFLNNTILKKMMKEAYKTAGMTVAQTEERYYIAGFYWEMDVRKTFMPKQILAQLIELAGEVLRQEVKTEGFTEPIDVTDIIVIGSLGTYQRVLQERGGKTHVVNNVFVDIADNNAIDENSGEYSVTTPLFNERKGILWQNNAARFRAGWRIDDRHESLLSELSGIDLLMSDES